MGTAKNLNPLYLLGKALGRKRNVHNGDGKTGLSDEEKLGR